jgi:hypothetical protein
MRPPQAHGRDARVAVLPRVRLPGARIRSRGVLPRGKQLVGRAYAYSSDGWTLRLDATTRPKDVKLRLGGFKCRPEGPATYAWSRFSGNYILRLEAIQDPCTVRRAILEGELELLRLTVPMATALANGIRSPRKLRVVCRRALDLAPFGD